MHAARRKADAVNRPKNRYRDGVKTSDHPLAWRRAAVLGLVWAALGGGAVAVSACYGRNCEGVTRTYGLDASEGRMVDDDAWESSPADGEWLPFPRQTSIIVTLPFGGRTPYAVWGWVSAQPTANASATLGAGNTNLFSSWGPNRVVATNDTCSDYYIRTAALDKGGPRADDPPTAPEAEDAGSPPP